MGSRVHAKSSRKNLILLIRRCIWQLPHPLVRLLVALLDGFRLK